MSKISILFYSTHIYTYITVWLALLLLTSLQESLTDEPEALRREEPNLTLSVISLVGAMLAVLALVLTLFSLLAFG